MTRRAHDRARLHHAALAALVLAATAGTSIGDVMLPAPGRGAWRPLAFRKVPRATAYEPVTVDGAAAIRAASDCSASALYLPLDGLVDLADTPRLSWRWRVTRGLSIANERVKAGDDFAARVYVTFEFDPDRATLGARLRHGLGERLFGEKIPGGAVTYVWTDREPAGSHWDSPFARESKMLSLGRGPLEAWRTEDVDVAADYRRLFGHPPPKLLGLALMTDSDNSCQRAEAYYADFRFHRPAAR